VDYLRQYVQCNADLTPMYLEDAGKDGLTVDDPYGAPINLVIRKHIIHTCRDFDKIHEWIMNTGPSRLPRLDHAEKNEITE
jgi:hypothetical protein